MNISRPGRFRVLVAGALTLPLALGTVAVASATDGDAAAKVDPSDTATHGTATLTAEGLKLAEGKPTSGSVSAGPEVATTSDGTDARRIDPSDTGDVEQNDEGFATASAALTEEGLRLAAANPSSGPVTASQNAIRRK